MIVGRAQGKESAGEPACCQTMLIMVSVRMMIIMLVTMTVRMVVFAACELLLANCNGVITLCLGFLCTSYLQLLLRTSILFGQLCDMKSAHRSGTHRL